MMSALEWGAFPYARDVLENWLTYFIHEKGFVLYRGLEMAQEGRMLTNTAQYYFYTRDGSMLSRHLDKIAGIVELLRSRRARSLAIYPQTDPRYGMPTGNDEADLFWDTIKAGNNATEMPFISIAAEMWRGFRDLGQALQEAASQGGGSNQEMARLGKSLAEEAPFILKDFQQSMARSVVPGNLRGTARCHPYVAGVPECGMLTHGFSNRDSEPWRTYAEAMYSGAIREQDIEEILTWHQTEQGSGVKGSRLKLGVLSGCGGDVSCGDSLETFTIHGWGYGLLTADLVEPFLLQYWAVSAHSYTRGTWIAPESTPIDRNQASPSFATPSGVTVSRVRSLFRYSQGA